MPSQNEETAVAIEIPGTTPDSRKIVLEHAANELVFGVVGHVGSGTTQIAETLKGLLSDESLAGGSFDTEIIKAREIISDWATSAGETIPTTASNDLTTSESLQNLGDKMRKEIPDHAAVAKCMALNIRKLRAQKTGSRLADQEPVKPDGSRRAYILDSIRHPTEVNLLRHVYQDAFILVGVVCEESKRLDRLTKKYTNAGVEAAKKFMKRDAKAGDTFGQRVSDAFHLADYFVDNTVSRVLDNNDPNEDWDINEKLSRLIKIVTHSEIMRPLISETAMHHAYGAKMRSACLSRQVGAALIDSNGNVLATGTNEVPKAGGGVYGESFNVDEKDHRCAFRPSQSQRKCSNTSEQNKIIDKLIASVPELTSTSPTRKEELKSKLRESPIGGLLEFSRAVHAEMDALLSAARAGSTSVGSRLFVTTFPCHYCARHIVSAGVDEVQYIEPYPKSQALGLHNDSIQVEHSNWVEPSQGGDRVLFRPFSGVAPRMYRRAFLKDRDLKNNETGELCITEPDWGSKWHLRGISYIQLESELLKNEANQ
ncbi:MAG: anti-phage dCTP deaminase [Candidatus Scalindua sp.]